MEHEEDEDESAVKSEISVPETEESTDEAAEEERTPVAHQRGRATAHTEAEVAAEDVQSNIHAHTEQAQQQAAPSSSSPSPSVSSERKPQRPGERSHSYAEPKGVTNPSSWERHVYDSAVKEAKGDGEFAGELLVRLGMIADWTSFARQHMNDPEPPESFLCPLTHKVMTDPIVLPTGVSCDRRALRQYLSQYSTCPETGEPLFMNTNSPLVANRALRAAINMWSSQRQSGSILARAVTKMRTSSAESQGGARSSQTSTPQLPDHIRRSSVPCSEDSDDAHMDKLESGRQSVTPQGNADEARARYAQRKSRSIVISEVSENRMSDPRQGISSQEIFRRAGVSQRSQHRPVLTALISLASIGVTLNALLCKGFKLGDLDANPFFGPPPLDLASCGLGISRRRVVDSGYGWVRLIAGPFLFAGALHIAIVLPGIIALLAPMERRYGMQRVGVPVLIAAYTGTFASPHLSPVRLTAAGTCTFLGAAGAVIADMLFNQKHQASTRTQIVTLLAMLPATGLVYGMISLPYIDAAGASLALASGLFLGMATFPPGKGSSFDPWLLVQFILVVACFFALILGVAALVREPLAQRMRQILGCGESCAYCYDIARFWTCEESRDVAPEQESNFVVVR